MNLQQEQLEKRMQGKNPENWTGERLHLEKIVDRCEKRLDGDDYSLIANIHFSEQYFDKKNAKAAAKLELQKYKNLFSIGEVSEFSSDARGKNTFASLKIPGFFIESKGDQKKLSDSSEVNIFFQEEKDYKFTEEGANGEKFTTQFIKTELPKGDEEYAFNTLELENLDAEEMLDIFKEFAESGRNSFYDFIKNLQENREDYAKFIIEFHEALPKILERFFDHLKKSTQFISILQEKNLLLQKGMKENVTDLSAFSLLEQNYKANEKAIAQKTKYVENLDFIGEKLALLFLQKPRDIYEQEKDFAFYNEKQETGELYPGVKVIEKDYDYALKFSFDSVDTEAKNFGKHFKNLLQTEFPSLLIKNEIASWGTENQRFESKEILIEKNSLKAYCIESALTEKDLFAQFTQLLQRENN